MNTATRDRIKVVVAYETAWAVPMTAAVAMFSRRIPVEPVIIIVKDVIDMAMVIARNNPIIICRYFFCGLS